MCPVHTRCPLCQLVVPGLRQACQTQLRPHRFTASHRRRRGIRQDQLVSVLLGPHSADVVRAAVAAQGTATKSTNMATEANGHNGCARTHYHPSCYRGRYCFHSGNHSIGSALCTALLRPGYRFNLDILLGHFFHLACLCEYKPILGLGRSLRRYFRRGYSGFSACYHDG